MTEADRLAIAIGEVDVADVATAGAERGGVRDFLDVHMEQVAEELHVRDLTGLEELGGVELTVQEIRLVAVERLVEERHAVLRGVGTKIGKCFGQPGQGLVARNVAFGLALHRADDGRGLELAGDVNDRVDEFTGLRADGRVGVGQVPLVDEPAATGAEGRGGEMVLLEQGVKGRAVDVGGRWGKNLDRVKAKLRGGGRSGHEAIPIHERSALGLGDE